MRWAIIHAGHVWNVVEAADQASALFNTPEGATAVQAAGANIGDTWDGNTFTPAPSVVPVPASVTMRQARLALHATGKLTAVEAAIDALSDPPKTAARIEWDFSNEVQRHNGFVASLAPALGLTEQQLDDLFRLAATL
jgi:predicted amidohydrolase YtcJ